MIRNEPYWWEAVSIGSDPQEDLPARADVVIVGGGLTGLTAAWRLHRAGHRVTVFEKAPQVGGAIVGFAKDPDGYVLELLPLRQPTPPAN